MRKFVQVLKFRLFGIEEVTLSSREWYEYVNHPNIAEYPALLRALHRATWSSWYPNFNGVLECELTMNVRNNAFMVFVEAEYGL